MFQQCLHSPPLPRILRTMPMTPQLTDAKALARNRQRARDFLWHNIIRDDVQERLTEVNRTFTNPAVVTPFPQIWADFAPSVAEGEVLPLDQGVHDLVVHALSLHWADDPVGQLVQCRRALRPDGMCIAFLFGGQTLYELRAALAEAEVQVTGGLSPRILPMGEIRDLGGLLQRAGFALPVADSFTKTLLYRDAFHLMRDLRAMGEGNALASRLPRPTKRAVFLCAAQIYAEKFSDPDGRIPASFEIIALTGWAAHDSQQKPLRPGSAAQKLAEALNATEFPLPRPASDG